ncbi:MAG TPA: hypothetical protein VFV75_00065 [Candidatus Polarisedimenticolaceae bacterium]|nr:hypothetical protein [Candidatus Polarisedimenticolaceae bacterium]
MRKCLALLGVAAVAVLLATSASAANRGVSFTGTGFISGPLCVAGPNAGQPCTTNAQCPSSRCQVPSSSVWDMDAAGSVFLVSPAQSGAYAAFWTRENGWGDLIGNANSYIVSPSGNTVMGNGIYPGSNPAYLWPGTWTGTVDSFSPIPSDPGYAACGSSRLSQFDMAGEGDYVTGLTWQGCAFAQGFLWDKATDTSIGLGRYNDRSTRGNAVTTDGSKVVGFGTMLQGLRRGIAWQNGSWSFLGDPGNHEPKICAQSGNPCTNNSANATTGCAEYVNDGLCANRGTCQDRGTCVSNVCVGGPNGGNSCTNSNQCPGVCGGGTNDGTQCTSNNTCAGTCTGPNAGAVCTSENTCPDTLVCIDNPDWTADMYKGETYDMSDDGQYACGRSFDYNTLLGTASPAGYRANPDGTFTKLDVVPDFPDRLVDPFDISDNGKVIGGRAGSFLTGTSSYLWIEGVGPLDLQTFLIAQGLDELHFWFLAQVNAVSADGKVIAGYGFNPDGWQEGFVVDMSKLWVCHTSGNSSRTLGIDLDSAADHVAHGDFLGTCEFQASGALSRAVETQKELSFKYRDHFRQSLVNEASSAWDLAPVELTKGKGKGKGQDKARGKGRD